MINNNITVESHIDYKAGVDGFSFGELLTQAHSKGLKGITVEVLQFPTKDNGMLAVCRATVSMADDRTFIDIADASPESIVDITMAHYLLRISSTRAKSRALRDALGVVAISPEQLLPNSKDEVKQPEIKATIRQIRAIEQLCKQLGRKYDPHLAATLNKVAASKLIMQLSDQIKRIS